MKQNIKKKRVDKCVLWKLKLSTLSTNQKIKNYDLRLSNTKILQQEFLNQKRLIKKC